MRIVLLYWFIGVVVVVDMLVDGDSGGALGMFALPVSGLVDVVVVMLVRVVLVYCG